MKTAIEYPLLRTACVEEIIMLAQSMMMIHDLLRSDIIIRYGIKATEASEHLKSLNQNITDWWESSLLVAARLNNEAMLKFLIYRFLLEGVNAICSLCSTSLKSVAKQLFKHNHKRQATLSRVNIFLRAVVEAYSDYYMTMTGEELDKQLKPLHVRAAWAQRKNIKPTKEIVQNACWNCKFLLKNVLKEYSWKGIKLLNECKMGKEANL